MYIKQVIIQGFRSYKDQVEIEPFSRQHNVIVGRNGSGKSNFFYAIQFVLSDEFSHLKPEQRQGLLYEGVGPRIVSAFVEIVFDNSDNRLPIDKEEVSLRRVIGTKKDQYYLEKKIVTKSEVMNLLESAGFSRSNPYYIVKQGKINQMALAPDSQRLKLLNEVAGTRVFSEKKEESKQILEETEVKRKKIEELMNCINERLKTLEEEKEELKKYQVLDKKKRSLEYAIYDNELTDVKNQIDALNKKRENGCQLTNEIRDSLQVTQDRIQECEKTLEHVKNRLESTSEENDILTGEKSKLIEKRTKYELTLADKLKELESNSVLQKNLQDDIQVILNLIEEKQSYLNEIVPKYEIERKKEEELQSQLALAEQQRKELFAKQGRGNQFLSSEERDDWIKKEIQSIEASIKDNQDQCTKIKDEIDQGTSKIKLLESKYSEMEQEIKIHEEKIELSTKDFQEMRLNKDNLQNERTQLWRHESTLQQSLSATKEEIDKNDNTMRSLVGKAALNGIDSIKKVLKIFQEQGKLDIVNGYYGLFIELFEVDKEFFTAVEVTAGSRLFYHVVESDKVGTKLLMEMNRRNLSGEATFLPLNQLTSSSIEYPNRQDSIPMIEKLRFDQKYLKTMKHVFGQTLICRSMEFATQIARAQKLDCVTLDGDQVSRRGALTGGYYDSRRSRLELQKNKTTLKSKKCEQEAELLQHQSKMNKLESEINQCLSDIQKFEIKTSKEKDIFEKLKSDMKLIKQEMTQIKKNEIPKERIVSNHESTIKGMQYQMEGLRNELGTKLLFSLSVQDQQSLDELNQKIQDRRKEEKKCFSERMALESEKNKVESNLENNLKKRLEALQASGQEMDQEKITRDVERNKSDLERINKRIEEINGKLNACEGELDDLNEEKKRITNDLDKLKLEEKDFLEKISEDTKFLEKMTSKQSLLLSKKEGCLTKIRDLGTLPTDAFNKYTNFSNKLLFKNLEECQRELKKYGDVNKKALDQYVSIYETKEKFTKQKEELDNGFKCISELIESLERKKSEAIQLTFKQVSKYFTEVFSKLVPEGHAFLVMNRQSESGSDSSSLKNSVSFDSLTGVGIRVSFTGVDGEMREMNQLSGGQKSIVALTLIFAIQKCDPAPFYLFDEIDQALDSEHRKAVARMIQELSAEAQFITTTFKSELLEFANKFYGVKFRNKVSHIETVSKEVAKDFVEDDNLHK